MNSVNTHLKALALLVVFVVGLTLLQQPEVFAQTGSSQQQTASIFNPIANFLGLSGGTGNDTPETQSTSGTNSFTNALSSFFGVNTPTGQADTATTTTTNAARVVLGGQTPILICVPSTVGAEEEVIIMWACRDEATSTESDEFETNGKTIGSVRVQPTEGNKYTITCVNETAGTNDTAASCNIVVAEPVLTITATPSAVPFGDTTVLAWSTTDTQACTLTSDAHFGFKRNGTQGQITTPGITKDTTFTLTCESISGLLVKTKVEVDAN